jgi:hypothetical protein
MAEPWEGEGLCGPSLRRRLQLRGARRSRDVYAGKTPSGQGVDASGNELFGGALLDVLASWRFIGKIETSAPYAADSTDPHLLFERGPLPLPSGRGVWVRRGESH